MNWTASTTSASTRMSTLVVSLVDSSVDEELGNNNVTLLNNIIINNSSSSSTVTGHINGSSSFPSDVVVAVSGLDSLMNVLIALVLALLILTTAIGK